MNTSRSQILVVDAGGQYCHLIARRVREAGVYATVCSPSDIIARSNNRGTRGVIISGGPNSVYASGSPQLPKQVFESGLPVLGICYGHQLMAHALGGEVYPGTEREYGESILEITGEDTILEGLRSREPVWMSHGDEVAGPPPGFVVLARTDSCRIAAMGNVRRKLFGVQFHPEVAHTSGGQRIIENFLFKVCSCKRDWPLSGIVPRLEKEIRKQAGSRNVLFFVSGGVDSTVAFSLCTDALGTKRVIGVFVDTGLMRKGEREEIEMTFKKRGWNNIHYEDAASEFLGQLDGVSDPEEKRHRIGECFLGVQKRVEAKLGLSQDKWMLGQGTIYPDTIESGARDLAAVIKTHHNRVPAIEDLIARGLVLEPLKEFYKDEVRTIGRELALPEELVAKHPFPGPGLAVRCLCSPDPFEIESSKDLSALVKPFGLQGWIVHLRTVGVQGDFRSYSNLVLLSGDAELDVFGTAARRITREIRGTNRVAFIVNPEISPEGARVERRYIDTVRLDRLREADSISQRMLRDEGLADQVWQFPVISLPLSLRGGETIALRPVSSADAMTARYMNLPISFIRRLAKRLLEIDGIDMVVYDVTDKPPATIEWE